MAELVEPPLPIPDVRGSNPVIGKKLFVEPVEHLFPVKCFEKKKMKEKEAGNF